MYLPRSICKPFLILWPANGLTPSNCFASGHPFISVKGIKQRYLNAPWGMDLDNIMTRNAIRALKLDRDPYFAVKLNEPAVFVLAKPTYAQ